MAHMEATILDTNFNIVGIVDDYQSMIWTERYAEAGDFELYGAIGSTISKYCQLGYFVTIPESNRAMIIESIEVSQELNESDKILVSGRSLEALLLRRIVWDQTILSGETYGKVQNAVKKLLTDNAIEPEDTNRAIPNLIFLDSAEEDITSLEFDSAQFTGNTLYDAVKQFADAFDIGFKIELFGTNLVFSLFAGKNRSFEQSTYNYVVYSSEYDNLLSSDFKQNITNFSNVALVAGEGEGSERRKIKYYYDFSEPSGMNRYELFVDARDISSTVDDGQGGSTQLTDQEYEYELANRGASKLAEVAEDYSFDAQIDTINSYQYGTDYFIGDILQLIDDMGNSGQFRITEFIRSMDASGYSAYPQFKIISRMDSVIPVDLQGLPARIASLPDCADEMPLKDLVVGIEPQQAGSGDPYPAAGGVNKWDEEWESGDLNVTSDGGNHANTNRIRSKNYIPVIPETSYYLTSSYSNTIVAFYDSSKAYPYNTQNVGWVLLPASKVITIPNWCYYIRFYYNSTAYSNDVALNYPSSVTTYSPYSNIRPISGWDSVKVSAVKQLFSGTLEQGSFNTITGEKVATTRRVRSVNDIPLPSGSYVLNNLNDWQFALYVYDLEGNFKNSESYTTWKNNPLSFSLVANRKINFPIKNDTNTTIVPSDVVGLTLYDSTDAQTITIPLPHTVYGGELDIVSGGGTLKYVKTTVDKSMLKNYTESYVVFETASDRMYLRNFLYGDTTGATGDYYARSIVAGGSFCISNVFKVLYFNDKNRTSTQYRTYFKLPDGVTDYASWQAYIQKMIDDDVDVEFCYEFSEGSETTYSATPTEITTQYGLNNIFADTGNINKVIYFKNKWR